MFYLARAFIDETAQKFVVLRPASYVICRRMSPFYPLFVRYSFSKVVRVCMEASYGSDNGRAGASVRGCLD